MRRDACRCNKGMSYHWRATNGIREHRHAMRNRPDSMNALQLADPPVLDAARTAAPERSCLKELVGKPELPISRATGALSLLIRLRVELASRPVEWGNGAPPGSLLPRPFGQTYATTNRRLVNESGCFRFASTSSTAAIAARCRGSHAASAVLKRSAAALARAACNASAAVAAGGSPPPLTAVAVSRTRSVVQAVSETLPDTLPRTARSRRLARTQVVTLSHASPLKAMDDDDAAGGVAPGYIDGTGRRPQSGGVRRCAGPGPELALSCCRRERRSRTCDDFTADGVPDPGAGRYTVLLCSPGIRLKIPRCAGWLSVRV